MSATYKPETLLVLREGAIDNEYYDAIYAERKREAIQQVGHNLVRFAVQAPVIAGRVARLLFHEMH